MADIFLLSGVVPGFVFQINDNLIQGKQELSKSLAILFLLSDDKGPIITGDLLDDCFSKLKLVNDRERVIDPGKCRLFLCEVLESKNSQE
jgi:hypothetical protein